MQGKDKNSNLFKVQSLDELLQTCPVNQIIGDNLVRAWSKINSQKYQQILCSISGGSDSDDMLDIVWRCDKNNKVVYIWFDTGLEYQATKEHLKYLEEKYKITIHPYKAIKPIPISCRMYGEPFLSKQVSEFIQRLQRHDFQWEDEDFDTLYKKYPKCKSALEWWCNTKQSKRLSIVQNKWLKEFIIANPPDFQISNKCCQYAKKDVAHKVLKEGIRGYLPFDLQIVGIRKAEGGARSTAYKSCFDETDTGCDNYRPLFWYKDSDKGDYEIAYGIEHSKCYTEYGLKRTGCAGCPFGRDFEFELEVIEKYEPKLFKAVNNIFGQSYEYTRAYRSFCEEMDKKYGSYGKYLAEKCQ